MKSRVLPLVLGGALALCLAVLGLAYWAFSSEALVSPESNASELSMDSATPAKLEPARPRDELAAQHGDAATRIAIAGEDPLAKLPQVEYELRSSDDQPLKGARAVLRRSEEVLGKDTADSQGVVHFDARDGHAELIVVAGNAPVLARGVPLSVGRHRVVLERGVAVSGRVLSPSKAPFEGIELELASDRPMYDDSGWPEAVREALELEDRDRLRLTAVTGEAGQFEFSGLVLPWSGRIELADTHELLSASAGIWNRGSNSIVLDDPIEGLVLDVAAHPLATGRVVGSAGGPGIPEASVDGALMFRPSLAGDENARASFRGRADEDGRFSLPIRRWSDDSFDPTRSGVWPALASATVTLDGGDGMPRRRLELTGEQLPAQFDFGELVLERGSTLRFSVADSQGAALAGAVAQLDGERSEPTGEDGQGSIVYAPGVTRPLGVSLPGYKDARVELPADISDVIPVALQRTTRLTVTVRDPAGAAMVGVKVAVHAPSQSSRGRGNTVTDQDADSEGRAVFNDVAVGVAVRVYVRDAMDVNIAEESLTLESGEWRSIEIATTRVLMSFEGVVRDELGLALAEVSLGFTDKNSRNRSNVSARSDANGRFEFHGLSSSVGQLRVRKTGFATMTLPDFQIPPPGVLAEIRLERGLRLTLRIVDERGAPVRGDSLRLELAGERPTEGRRHGENEWDFGNLPRVTMTAVAQVAGREYRQDIEPLNGNQEFRVPVHGALELVLRLEPSANKQPVRMVLRSRDDRRIQLIQNAPRELLQTRLFSPVLPGEYQLTISQLVLEADRGTWVNLGATERVDIAPSQQTRLEVSR